MCDTRTEAIVMPPRKKIPKEQVHGNVSKLRWEHMTWEEAMSPPSAILCL